MRFVALAGLLVAVALLHPGTGAVLSLALAGWLNHSRKEHAHERH